MDRKWISTGVDALAVLVYAMLFLYPAIPYGAAITLTLSISVFALSVLDDRSTLKVKPSAFYPYVLAVVGYCCLSALWEYDAGRALPVGMSLLKTTLVIFPVFAAYQNRQSTTPLVNAMLWGGYLACAVIVVLYNPVKLVMLSVTGVRIDNTFLNANTIGLVAAVTAIVHLHMILQRRKLKWIDVLLVFVIWILAISGSKKALLFLIGGYFLLFIFKSLDGKNSLRRVLFTVAVLAVITIAVIMLPIFDHMRFRLKSMVLSLLEGPSTESSTNLRLLYMQVGLQAFFQNPLFGIGMDSSWKLVEQTVGTAAYLHCNYVELLACGGIVGFILFYSIYGYLGTCLFRLRHNRDAYYPLIVTLFVLLLVMDVAMVSYYNKETYFYLLLLYLYVQELKTKKGIAK